VISRKDGLSHVSNLIIIQFILIVILFFTGIGTPFSIVRPAFSVSPSSSEADINQPAFPEADSNEKCAEADINQPNSPEVDINQNKFVSGSGVAIPVGIHPIGIATNPQNGKIYVANAGSDTVSVIDSNTFKVISTIPVGNNPLDVALNPSNGKVYVTNYFSDTVSILDSRTDTTVGSVQVGARPVGVVINPADGKVYVANEGSNSISIIDDKTNKAIGNIQAGVEPQSLAIMPINSKLINLLVTNYGSNDVSVFRVSSTQSNPASVPEPIRNNNTDQHIAAAADRALPLPIPKMQGGLKN
jgi:YVTN family beta-propeller protein